MAVARAATFATTFVVLDEPTAALGVKETGQVLRMIRQIKSHGLPVILCAQAVTGFVHTFQLRPPASPRGTSGIGRPSCVKC